MHAGIDASGSWTAEEARFLDNMLFDLRMLFVQVSKRPTAPDKT